MAGLCHTELVENAKSDPNQSNGQTLEFENNNNVSIKLDITTVRTAGPCKKRRRTLLEETIKESVATPSEEPDLVWKPKTLSIGQPTLESYLNSNENQYGKSKEYLHQNNSERRSQATELLIQTPASYASPTTKVNLSGRAAAEIGVENIKENETAQGKNEPSDSNLPTDYRSLIKASVLRQLPATLPRHPPAVVLDLWHHGQLVWWNRFLANRKRTQGTGVGNFVGRVVDLDSEWFPNVLDLQQTKLRLRNLAAAMGRRSMVVQGFSEMRYLTLPPRAVSPFPDPDAVRQQELLAGLRRAGGLNARRGLKLAFMVEELRNDLNGETNSVLEIEFLDLCMTYQSKQQTVIFTETDLERFELLSVWDVLRHRSFETHILTLDGCKVYQAPISAESEKKTTLKTSPQTSELSTRRSGYSRSRRMRHLGGETQLMRRERRKSSSEKGALKRKVHLGTLEFVRPRFQSTSSTSQNTIMQCKKLCKILCLKRSELMVLLRGIPITLLVSSTGLSLPEELPSYSLKILEAFHAYNEEKEGKFIKGVTAHHRLLGLHYSISANFLYKLFSTVALRIAVKSVSPETVETPMKHIILTVDHLHQEPTTLLYGTNKIYGGGLSEASSPIYRLPFELTCARASRLLWQKSCITSDPFPSTIQCRKTTLRVLGCGLLPNKQFGYYSVKLHQISDKEPLDDELAVLATSLVQNAPKWCSRDLEKRVEELNILREVATYSKSIYDDITTLLRQTNGTLSPEDGRYFESLWLDVQRKLK